MAETPAPPLSATATAGEEETKVPRVPHLPTEELSESVQADEAGPAVQSPKEASQAPPTDERTIELAVETIEFQRVHYTNFLKHSKAFADAMSNAGVELIKLSDAFEEYSDSLTNTDDPLISLVKQSTSKFLRLFNFLKTTIDEFTSDISVHFIEKLANVIEHDITEPQRCISAYRKASQGIKDTTKRIADAYASKGKAVTTLVAEAKNEQVAFKSSLAKAQRDIEAKHAEASIDSFFALPNCLFDLANTFGDFFAHGSEGAARAATIRVDIGAGMKATKRESFYTQVPKYVDSIREIVTREVQYKDVLVAIEYFHDILIHNLDNFKLAPPDIEGVFTNSRLLLTSQEDLCRTLQAAVSTSAQPELLIKRFAEALEARVKPLEDAYLPYIENVSYSCYTLGCLVKKNKALYAKVKELEKTWALSNDVPSFQLESMLEEPCTHFTILPSVLKSLLAQIPQENVGWSSLKEMIDKYTTLVTKLNDAQKESKAIKEIIKAKEKLTDADDLIVGSRELILNEDFNLDSAKCSEDSPFQAGQEYNVLLFNDIIAFVSTKKKLVYKIENYLASVEGSKDNKKMRLDYGDMALVLTAASSDQDIAGCVKQFEEALSSRKKTQFFGVPLEEIMARPSEKKSLVPHAIESLISYIKSNGMATEGIFRISGKKTATERLRNKINAGKTFSFSDVTVATSLFKSWIRELPEPLMTFKLYNEWIDSQSSPEKLRALMNSLPECNKLMLYALMKLCCDISKNASVNRMGSENLAIVIAPNVLYAKGTDVDPIRCTKTNSVITEIINNFDVVFADVIKENSDRIQAYEKAIDATYIRRSLFNSKKATLSSFGQMSPRNTNAAPSEVFTQEVFVTAPHLVLPFKDKTPSGVGNFILNDNSQPEPQSATSSTASSTTTTATATTTTTSSSGATGVKRGPTPSAAAIAAAGRIFSESMGDSQDHFSTSELSDLSASAPTHSQALHSRTRSFTRFFRSKRSDSSITLGKGSVAEQQCLQPAQPIAVSTSGVAKKKKDDDANGSSETLVSSKKDKKSAASIAGKHNTRGSETGEDDKRKKKKEKRRKDSKEKASFDETLDLSESKKSKKQHKRHVKDTDSCSSASSSGGYDTGDSAPQSDNEIEITINSITEQPPPPSDQSIPPPPLPQQQQQPQQISIPPPPLDQPIPPPSTPPPSFIPPPPTTTTTLATEETKKDTAEEDDKGKKDKKRRKKGDDEKKGRRKKKGTDDKDDNEVPPGHKGGDDEGKKDRKSKKSRRKKKDSSDSAKVSKDDEKSREEESVTDRDEDDTLNGPTPVPEIKEVTEEKAAKHEGKHEEKEDEKVTDAKESETKEEKKEDDQPEPKEEEEDKHIEKPEAKSDVEEKKEDVPETVTEESDKKPDEPAKIETNTEETKEEKEEEKSVSEEGDEKPAEPVTEEEKKEDEAGKKEEDSVATTGANDTQKTEEEVKDEKKPETENNTEEKEEKEEGKEKKDEPMKDEKKEEKNEETVSDDATIAATKEEGKEKKDEPMKDEKDEEEGEKGEEEKKEEKNEETVSDDITIAATKEDEKKECPNEGPELSEEKDETNKAETNDNENESEPKVDESK